MLTFPIEQQPDGRWRVFVESTIGRNVIGSRLWKHGDPSEWPDLEDTFGSQLEAQAKASEWAAYVAGNIKLAKKRGRR